MQQGPLSRFHRWFQEAARAGIEQPEAMALATADARGRPSVRFVLLKQADESGFVFYTDSRSRKGRDLAANHYASAVFYWHPTGKQVRIAGRVEQVSAAEADQYWSTRPRASQLAATASRQSAPLDERAALVGRWRKLRRRFRGKSIPRPPQWTGYRIVPEVFEFWVRRNHRLHHRELFQRTRRGWKSTLLQP